MRICASFEVHHVDLGSAAAYTRMLFDAAQCCCFLHACSLMCCLHVEGSHDVSNYGHMQNAWWHQLRCQAGIGTADKTVSGLPVCWFAPLVVQCLFGDWSKLTRGPPRI